MNGKQAGVVTGWLVLGCRRDRAPAASVPVRARLIDTV
jgi:hypothetical protein